MSLMFDVAVIAALIVINGVLALSEMAIVSSRRARLLELAEKGESGARIALNLISNPSSFLASIQVGITLIGIFAGAFSGVTLAKEVGLWIASITPLSDSASHGVAFAVIVTLMTFLSLIAGELVPKRVALAHPEAIAAAVARPLSMLSLLLGPVVKILSAATESMMRLLGIRTRADTAVTEDEVKIMIEQGAETGVFEKTEETIMKRAMQLNDIRASDIMTPRPQVETIDVNWSYQEVVDFIRRTGRSYYPSHDGGIDTPIGLFSTKLFFADPKPMEPSFSARKYMLDPLYIPETMRSSQIIQKFKQTSRHVSIVIDEFGGMAGLVTISDIMEAMIGFLPSEEEEEDKFCIQRDDGSWLADGMIPIRLVSDYTSSERLEFLLDEEDVQTLGGWMMKELGRIPTEGDKVIKNGIQFEVVDMDRHRVDKILIEAPTAACQ